MNMTIGNIYWSVFCEGFEASVPVDWQEGLSIDVSQREPSALWDWRVCSGPRPWPSSWMRCCGRHGAFVVGPRLLLLVLRNRRQHGFVKVGLDVLAGAGLGRVLLAKVGGWCNQFKRHFDCCSCLAVILTKVVFVDDWCLAIIVIQFKYSEIKTLKR